MQAEINLNKDMALKAMGETEEMAQYLRRDCLEISGVKSNAEFSSENIVESIGKVLNVSVTENDISVAHPRAAKNQLWNSHARKFAMSSMRKERSSLPRISERILP